MLASKGSCPLSLNRSDSVRTVEIRLSPMNIILAEERAGQPYPERAFTSEIIRVGRDPIECHLVFDQAEWPMVSRRHSEFRWRDGCCYVVDTNSRFGTFLDGQRVVDPSEVRTGMRVQFGAGGPVVRVVRIEQTAPALVVSRSA